MIMSCCVLAIVLVCFLICILRNSDILEPNTINQSQNNLNLNDVYLINDDNSNSIHNSLLINLPFEKPPSYFETIGRPPPIYQSSIYNNSNVNQQSQICILNHSNSTNRDQNLFSATTSSNVIDGHDELILDCNRWLEQSNNERSNLETKLLQTRLTSTQEYRENLRKLSRNSERCNLPSNLPPNILSRSHSSPVIRNSLLLRTQHLFNVLANSTTNDTLINSLASNPCSSSNLLNDLTNDNQCSNASTVDQTENKTEFH